MRKNLESRLNKLEEITQPRKIVVCFTPMEAAARIMYLIDRVQKKKPMPMSRKAADRLFDLMKNAAARKI